MTLDEILDAADEHRASDVFLQEGELPRLIRICRAPDRRQALAFSGTVRPELKAAGDNPLFVRVTLADGTRAWSSPIYVYRA